MSACSDKVHEMYYSFGGHAVRMCIVGDRLAERLTLPFVHLRSSDSSLPSLAVDLWEQRETGIGPKINVARDSQGLSPRFSMSSDGRFVTSVLRYSIASLDRQEGRIVGVALDADRLSLYERGRPLHVPLSLWYADRDVPLVHAALVSHAGDGILLVGHRGTGKTASSLSCTTAGFSYLADDLTGLRILADGAAWGYSVFSSAFIDEQTLLRSPTLARHAIPGVYSHEDKWLLFVSQAPSLKLMPKTRIRAVVLLRIADADRTLIRPATRSESLLIMARSTLRSGVLSPGRKGFELLGRLSESVPSFWLELGVSPEETPHCLRELLASVRGSKE
jgi:hypothetical protein